MRRLVAIGLAVAASFAIAPAADASATRCARWTFPGMAEGGEPPSLVIQQAHTKCSKAEALGDAWWDSESWRPQRLRAGGVSWRLVSHRYSGWCDYRSLTYRASGSRAWVRLTYRWDASMDDPYGCEWSEE
jgi:hypothetical protein